jgi:dipeptidyl aminopeptidase/acylaminoacyl peptidase
VSRASLVALIATASAVAPAVGGATARADSIFYRCFPNVCRVAPDGSGPSRVTRDGSRDGRVYGWLSASADGSRLGVSFGNRAFVLDASGRKLAGPLEHSGGAVLQTQIRPDGRQVATIETVGESEPPPLRPVPYLFLAEADGTGRDTVARSTAATAWLGGRLLRDESASNSPFVQQICLLASNADFPCERLVASDPERDLWDPAVSPDGRFVAVTRAPVDAFQGEIAIYSTATGQLVRVLTSGPADSLPSWSPDGGSIVFTRGDAGLWVVRAGGAPGSERRILGSGVQPVWVSGGGAAPRLTGPKRVRAGARVLIRLRDAPRGARASLQRRVGRGWRTLAKRTTGPSPTVFAIRFPRSGRAVLRIRLRTSNGSTTVSKPLTVRVVSARPAMAHGYRDAEVRNAAADAGFAARREP